MSHVHKTVIAAVLSGLLVGCQAGAVKGGRGDAAPPQKQAAPTASASAFNGDEAFGFLKAQCDFGPRVPATPAHERCRDYLMRQLTPYVDRVVTQQWTYRDDSRHVTLPLTNILGIINPQATRRVMLFTHWDTRPTADQELDAADKKKPIPGADDGASGTAVLLELARVLHKQKPAIGIELLFVDGEDWGPGDDRMYLGAIHFAQNPGRYKPEYAILLDMIGDKDLNIYREKSSEGYAPGLDDKVWSAAAALGDQAQFPNAPKWQITDDHDSFNAAGIPAIDLIDFDYAYWHTLQDTPDKCSPQSLKIVGDVMLKVLTDER